MSKIHNLEEYMFAKKIVGEVPQVLNALDKCRELLYDHKQYRDVTNIIQEIEEVKMILGLSLEVYTEVLKKGAINE